MFSIQLQVYLDNMKDRKQQAVTLDVRKPIGHTGQFAPSPNVENSGEHFQKPNIKPVSRIKWSFGELRTLSFNIKLEKCPKRAGTKNEEMGSIREKWVHGDTWMFNRNVGRGREKMYVRAEKIIAKC